MSKVTVIWHRVCIAAIFFPTLRPYGYMLGLSINFSWYIAVLFARVYYKINVHKRLRNNSGLNLSINQNRIADITFHAIPFFIIYKCNWGELVNIQHVVFSYIFARIWNYTNAGILYGKHNKLYFYYPVPEGCWNMVYVLEVLLHILYALCLHYIII